MQTDPQPDPPAVEADSEPGPEPGAEPESRLSWAAYFGAATGLCVGVIVAMASAACAHYLAPGHRAAEVIWEVASPLLALLGCVGCGFGFQRIFGPRLVLPVLIFVLVAALGAYLAFGPLGFPWRAEAAAVAG
ncbi:MAG: hypothetical protein JXR96_12800 [Deltaproteobacteria bacterium]|nr:hypothetical protein [Deltaproteobacteria bacterium]